MRQRIRSEVSNLLTVIMGFESDDQIAARAQRQREVKAAWRNWKRSKRERRIIADLPSASPTPKSIIITRGRVQDSSGGGIPTYKHHRRKKNRKKIRGG